MSPTRPTSRRASALLVALLLALTGVLIRPGAAAALPLNPRAFSCSGSAGDIYTQMTVTGLLTAKARPYQVVVTRTYGAQVMSSRNALAALRGPSPLHAGYTEWDVTGDNPDGNLFWLSLPPVIPGAGGFFDADLDVEWSGGDFGGAQVLMFDCTVTGGPDSLTHPASPRAFSCTGNLGEAYTMRTVSGLLNRNNRPYNVSVIQTGTGTVESARTRLAASRGPSPLHAGYVEWDVTGRNPDGNFYWLSVPPVLPAAGGFFDADLDIEFAGGANGGWQIPMFDCTVSPGA